MKCFVNDMILNAINGMTYICFWISQLSYFCLWSPKFIFVITWLIRGKQCKYYGFAICGGFLSLKFKFLNGIGYTILFKDFWICKYTTFIYNFLIIIIIIIICILLLE